MILYAIFHFHLQVAYIDTEGTFRPDRIRSIADRFGGNGDMALENILYGTMPVLAYCRYWLTQNAARAFNSEHQVCSPPLLEVSEP